MTAAVVALIYFRIRFLIFWATAVWLAYRDPHFRKQFSVIVLRYIRPK